MKKKQLPIFLLLSLFCSGLYANSLASEMDSFLKDYTTPRGVRYRALKNNARLKHLFGRLRNMPLPASRKAQEAYWINLYNIATIKLISDHYPVKSITDLHLAGSRVIGTIAGKTIWQTWKFSVRGKPMTLDKIEHTILRPKFRDFRVHAALVCAARSCPPLRREAYRSQRLDRQLDEQMRLWLSDPSKNRYDAQKNILYLSKIFTWFERDFTQNGKRDLIETILPYLPPKTASVIRAKRKTLRIRYLGYNWALNESR